MAALSTADAGRLLELVAAAETTDDDPPFTRDFLVALRDLVDADWSGYTANDRVRRRVLGFVESSDYEVPCPDPLHWTAAETYPLRLALARGHPGALKVSDFFTRRQLRATPFYDWFRLYGVEHSLEVQLPSPLWHTKTFSFDRHGGHDFTERDRLVVTLLRPHLKRLWDDAQTRRRLRAALHELDRAAEASSDGVILLSPAGRVEYSSAKARRLLRVFFGVKPNGALPATLVEWIRSDSRDPFLELRGSRRLIVERDGQTLLLSDRRVEPVLTAREQEVLSWVARGKTNAEIATLLWLAPSTVRKHLENVYAKLGVNTRTAAVARFLGLLEAEAS